MATNEKPKLLLRTAEIATLDEFVFNHPLNPASEIRGRMVSRLTGLTHTGVSIVRVPPGRESFVYHSHRHEEEWVFILSGRGVAEIDGEEHDVGAGDFMGFPTPSVAHHLRNPFDGDLVYLMGGENRDCEVADFPRLRKRLIRSGDEIRIIDWDDLEPFAR